MSSLRKADDTMSRGIRRVRRSTVPWKSASVAASAKETITCRNLDIARIPCNRWHASSGGTNGACDGSLSLDWTQYIATNPGSVGVPFAGDEIVYAQAWFRDPPSPKTTNLTDALSFDVCP